ncbi:MAG TPA: TonB-dependent receptor [Burkholderiales bacterium]
MKLSLGLGVSLGACAAILLYAPVCAAATEQATESAAAESHEEDIIVTAQKRSENVRDVPLAISAFGGETLAKSNVVQLYDLQRLAPSLRVDLGARADKLRIVIRGVGSSGGTAIEPSVATFLDGVYIPREGATTSAYLDIEAVEVLRGPQGTLFGRNASVGAINLRSVEPGNSMDGRLSAEFGTGERYKLDGFVNLPVNEKLSLRLAGIGEIFNGLYVNRADGRRVGGIDTLSVRASAKLALTDSLTNVLRISYSSRQGNDINNMYALLPDSFPAGGLTTYLARFAAIGSREVDLNPFDRKVNEFIDDRHDDTRVSITNKLSWETEAGFTVNLISAYQDWRNRQEGNYILSTQTQSLVQFGQADSKSHSEELQLISPEDMLGGRLSFVGGLYYAHEKLRIGEAFQFKSDLCNLVLPGNALYASCLAGTNGLATNAQFHQTTDSIAAYGQATVHIVPTVDLTLGARWSQDKKTALLDQQAVIAAGGLLVASETVPLKLKEDRPTYRANLSWKPSDRALLFVSYTTGFKSGGFNSATSNVRLGQTRKLNPETVKSYEFGLKTSWFNRLLQLDVVAYRMDISNFQDRSFNGLAFALQNAGDIRNKGVEIDAVLRPVRGLRFNANVAYLDSVFTSYPGGSNLPGRPGTQDLSGKRPTFTPKWSGSVGGEYEGGLGATGWTWLARTDLSFTSRANIGGVNNADPNTVWPSYALLGGRITVARSDKRWSASIFGQNLTNKGYCTSVAYQPFGALLGAIAGGQSALRCNVVGPPRTFGMAISHHF